jgi:hypothetical protein
MEGYGRWTMHEHTFINVRLYFNVIKITFSASGPRFFDKHRYVVDKRVTPPPLHPRHKSTYTSNGIPESSTGKRLDQLWAHLGRNRLQDLLNSLGLEVHAFPPLAS